MKVVTAYTVRQLISVIQFLYTTRPTHANTCYFISPRRKKRKGSQRRPKYNTHTHTHNRTGLGYCATTHGASVMMHILQRASLTRSPRGCTGQWSSNSTRGSINKGVKHKKYILQTNVGFAHTQKIGSRAHCFNVYTAVSKLLCSLKRPDWRILLPSSV